MQEKVVYGEVLVDISRKFRKNTHFWEKNAFTNGEKSGDTLTNVPRPPSKISLTCTRLAFSVSK